VAQKVAFSYRVPRAWMLLVDIVKLNSRPQDRRASLRHNPHTFRGGTIPTMTTAIVVISL
jgi:hypothetical protein